MASFAATIAEVRVLTHPYTALTRARQLVVIVGQKKALYLAVRDWRRAARHTALGGLLAGSTRFRWNRTGDGHGSTVGEDEQDAWEGLTAAASEP